MEMMIKALFISLLTITIITPPAHSAYYSTSEPYNPVQLEKTQLRFFLHDTLSGPNPTAVLIAGPKGTDGNPIPPGALVAMNDPLTEGPEATSEVVGNAQGMYLSSGEGAEVSIVTYVDFGFTTGEFNGSSVSVFSRNPLTENPREVAVVGGRGRFGMAAGTATVTTYFMDITTGDAVIEYNVEVVYPKTQGLGFIKSVV